MPVLVLMEDSIYCGKNIVFGCSLTFILVGILTTYKTWNQCYCSTVNNKDRGGCNDVWRQKCCVTYFEMLDLCFRVLGKNFVLICLISYYFQV